MKNLRLSIGILALFMSVQVHAVPSPFPCDVTAYGNFPDGESFTGNFIDDGTDFIVHWEHHAPGMDFVTDFADPSSSCMANGEINADIWGTGNVNGVSGYTYFIHLVDNRPLSDTLLTASIVRTPTVHNEGVAAFDPPRTVSIPAMIPVTEGASGMGWVKLHLDDVICRYSGTGSAYAFQRCTNPGGSDYSPGALLDVSNARLRLLSADSGFEITTIRIDIGTVVPGDPDRYSIDIIGPGSFSYSFNGNINDGDINIVDTTAP